MHLSQVLAKSKTRSGVALGLDLTPSLTTPVKGLCTHLQGQEKLLMWLPKHRPSVLRLGLCLHETVGHRLFSNDLLSFGLSSRGRYWLMFACFSRTDRNGRSGAGHEVMGMFQAVKMATTVTHFQALSCASAFCL